VSYYIFLGLLVGGIATLIGCFVGSSMKAARPDTSGLILSIIVGVIFWYLFQPIGDATDVPNSLGLGGMAKHAADTVTDSAMYIVYFILYALFWFGGTAVVIFLFRRRRFQ
jgi:uncharacterized membrane protein HdeD (DUF308 family)